MIEDKVLKNLGDGVEKGYSPEEVFDMILKEKNAQKSVERSSDSIQSLGAPEAVARRRQPDEAILGTDKSKTSLVDSAEIGPDGQFIEEKKPSIEINKFESPVVDTTLGEVKPGAVNATDNATRAEQAVREPAIQIKTAKPETKEILPQININADQSREDAPVAEQRQESEHLEPKVTIDKIEPAPGGETIQIQADPTIADELDRTAGAPLPVKTVDTLNSPNPVLKMQETAEQKDSTAQQTGEQVPITIVQPKDEYFGSSDQKVSGQGGLERIRKIKEGINGNGNAESLEPPKYDKLDKEVKQVREETLREDGIDPGQVEINKLPVEPAKTVEQPKVEVSGGNDVEEDNRTRRLFINRRPDNDLLRNASEIGRQKEVTSADLSLLRPGLRPGNMIEQVESEEEELPMAA